MLGLISGLAHTWPGPRRDASDLVAEPYAARAPAATDHDSVTTAALAILDSDSLPFAQRQDIVLLDAYPGRRNNAGNAAKGALQTAVTGKTAGKTGLGGLRRK